MGRVTVFAINGCRHCARAKAALKDRHIPYLEINLSSHPDKRSSLLNLSDSLTVPQIFFNEKHIGGADELIDLLEKWDSEAEVHEHGTPSQRYEREVGAMPDPTDQRLQPSTNDPVKEVVAPPRSEGDKIQLPESSGGKLLTYLEMTQRLLSSMKTTNLTYHGKLYRNSITGQNMVLYLMAEFNLTKEEAVKFGLYLSQRKLLTHVTGDHDFTDRSDLYYRLQPHQNHDILNSYRVWTDRVDPNSLAVVSRLSKKMQGIFDRAALHQTDGNVNLHSASLDAEYEQFEEEVCELQKISIEDMEKNYLTAYAINVYNLMIKYAQVKVGVPTTNTQRLAFFNNVTMDLGGEFFSFQELENGILRANAVPPYALRKVFSPTDKRLRLALKVDKVDPRIHFGLNCGARSCPPVKKFTASDLNEELRIVALAFCEQDDNVMIKESSNTVVCNTIFKWYMDDFAPSTSQLPVALLAFLKGAKKQSLQNMIDKSNNKGSSSIKVEFFKYDWSSNVTESKKFSKSNLSANQYTLKSILCIPNC
mmetsp:Transcript_14737/g.22332  ORF Transcript_14737/g.22332 Transcript_14737/m.22332 type:complete len:534 (-) Transcript_14737:59-1660(-)|eukprot:CAMPEP_0203680542 /NCGR_PEP_ID=MMETSP0090-20130426/39635_1 /ASSEMBLY_ACC=CAM_ASM_001088 /TAXON_ID=426623 /ORGANISM="Chaetoceros affinis, Strain CCMP159" /LENGTH=533 /DNA_ID=CAMNT_0050548657 /DNA_START=1 /DNA_END=1602 /DNA_ORIENTATION=+